MALNKTVLGALMRSKVHAIGPVSDGGEGAYFEALAEAIIEHFTLAAVVNTGVNTAVTAAVTTLPAVAGTGVGTGVGKIT